MQKNKLQIMKYNSIEFSYELGIDVHTNTNIPPSTNISYLYKIHMIIQNHVINILVMI